MYVYVELNLSTSAKCFPRREQKESIQIGMNSYACIVEVAQTNYTFLIPNHKNNN